MTGGACRTRTVRRLARRTRLVLRRRVALEHVAAHAVARARRCRKRVLALRARRQVRGAAAVRRHRRLRRLPLALLAHRQRCARRAVVRVRPRALCARHARLADAVGCGAAGGLLALSCRARAPRDAILLRARPGRREGAARARGAAGALRRRPVSSVTSSANAHALCSGPTRKTSRCDGATIACVS